MVRTEAVVQRFDFEAHEVWVIRGPRRNSPAWCHVCVNGHRMLTPEEVARLRGVGTRAVYRWVEAGRVHFTETADGGLLICLASLVTGSD